MAAVTEISKPQISAVRHEGKEFPEVVKIAVLISNKGTGSNLQALIDAKKERKLPKIEIGLVLSDQPDAKGLERAINHDIPYDVIPFQKGENRDFYSSNIALRLNQEGVGICVMAGWARILSEPYFRLFKGVTINVHPGLLPEVDKSPYLFPDGSKASWNQGLMTEKAVANFLGGNWAGSTVHVATLNADSGPVIERTLVPVLPSDTVAILYDRMKPEEHKALVRALQYPKRIFDIAGRVNDSND
ncbi:MAG: hypothetical protein A3A51_03250 [Candidatus Levybacteria bacterium RIFCSPLOWO2_01_FULL_39_10]|nr:MAG: hypothetical protein A3A51_03250 [Candidatus Levybacteria bacterium RIFCSPLOWO2_01_FULL_39_10]